MTIFSGEAKINDYYEEWYKASFMRFSTRLYDNKAIEKKHKEKINTLIDKMNQLNEGITFYPVYSSDKKMFASFGFTQLRNVPAFVAVFIDNSKSASLKAGFYGEGLCLEMTKLGLKSCWVSGSIKRQNLKDYIDIDSDKKFLTSIAFGYGKSRSLSDVEQKRKRKPIEKIFESDKNNETALMIIDCARNAPSAMNRQPWRYELKESMLFIKNPLIKGGPYPAELDIGISMMHVTCAAKAKSIKTSWEEKKGYTGGLKL